MKDPIVTTKLVAIDSVTPHPDNPRRGVVSEIQKSLARFGQYRPIVVQQSTNRILAGNHTWHAAVAEGHKKIRASILDVTDDEARAIMLADNRLADLGGYDDTDLLTILQMASETTEGLAGTGYDPDDLDILFAKLDDTKTGRASTTPRESKIPTKNHKPKFGDVWQLGRHRLIVGDARSTEPFEIIPAGINLVVTSPPYAEQRNYDTDLFDPIPPDEYVAWWAPLQANIANHLADDGSMFVNIKPSAADLDTDLYVFDLVLAHVREWGWHFATEFVWERTGVPKAPVLRFKNQFEPIYQFTRGRWKFRPKNVRHYSSNVPVPGGEGIGNTAWAGMQGQPGSVKFGGQIRRERAGRTGIAGYHIGDDVQGQPHPDSDAVEGLAYPGNRLPTFSGSHEITGHPAAYPVGLPEFFINAFTDPDDTILDPFSGSGSTILAAEATGRVGYAIEIGEVYANQTINRWNYHHPDQPARRE